MIFLKGIVDASVKDVRPLISLFKADYWRSPTKKTRDVSAGDEINPKGCTPNSGKKGMEARFIR